MAQQIQIHKHNETSCRKFCKQCSLYLSPESNDDKVHVAGTHACSYFSIFLLIYLHYKIKETFFIQDFKPAFNVNINSEKLMPFVLITVKNFLFLNIQSRHFLQRKRSLEITLKMYVEQRQHTKRQVYQNAKAHNVYQRCLCFIFDQTAMGTRLKSLDETSFFFLFFFLSNKSRSFDSISEPCKYFDYPDYEVCQEVAWLRASILHSARSSRDATEVATTEGRSGRTQLQRYSQQVPRGPFLENPGNFSGPKSNIQLDT